jgi:phosphoribosylformylglycinamidine cyclo-ligase
VVDLAGLGWQDTAPFADAPLGQALLAPTRLYVTQCLTAIRAGGVHALAHITGGGVTENVPRVLPDGMGVSVNLDAWELPPVFRWLAETGGMAQSELLKTFNSGIGMVLVVDPAKAAEITGLLRDLGETVYTLGHVTDTPGVHYSGQLL